MMKKFLKYLLCAVIFVSCTQKEEFSIKDGELVEVQFLVPQIYSHGSSNPATKAVGDMKDLLDTLPKSDLPEGTTLWLTYEHLVSGDNPATPDVVETSYYDSPVLKPYVVKSSSGGYKALYACMHSENDEKTMMYVSEDDALTTTVPLYLKHGQQYRFRMISPAMPIYKQNLSMPVDNGDSFCASDERYEQTRSSVTTIESSLTGINYVALNPMIQQTARLFFTLKKGPNVSSIRMMGNGVEVTGIQDPYAHGDSGNRYNWSSMEAADTLVMRLGDKRAWVNLAAGDFVEDAAGNLIGSVCILPTDARSNTVSILFNVSVNGVPTQYFTTLNGMIFEHGKSYQMSFIIGLKNNIVVVNWQNVSWTDNIS